VRELSRREVLGALTLFGAGAAAGCGRRPEPADVEIPSGWESGEERWIPTTCGQCPAGCGIRVRVFEGRAVKIEGNPAHPINGGGIGPKGQAGLQLLYHPDRIRGPLERSGPRGSGRWTRITWDTAIERLASELGTVRGTGHPEGLVVIDGEPRGVVPRLWDRFLRAYGSPNHVTHVSTSEGASALAMRWMQGSPELPAYDWPNTGYVLGFGVGLFESWCQTMHMSRASGALRRGTPGQRAKFVHVASRFSVTAAKADEWIAIEPGTDGALALAIAHVLIRDGLHDRAFVAEHTFGFDDFRDTDGRTHRGFRTMVLSEYAPEKVSPITGVAPETIVRIAREMSAHRPVVALGDGAACGATNALGTAMAIHALNGLLGSLERRGGVLVQRPVLASWTAGDSDAAAQAGLRAECIDGRNTGRCALGNGAIQSVPDAILSGRPYPVKALLLYRSNPAFSKPEGRKWRQALGTVPFVVSFSPLPDESTMSADLVLPDHTYLERWEVVEPTPSSGLPLLGLRQPVVAPRRNAMATGDVVIRLARAMGPPMANLFAWPDYGRAVAELPQSIAADPADAGQRTVAALIPAMRETGAAWGTQSFERWQDAFATPSGKFEFYSQAIKARLAAVFSDDEALDGYLAAEGARARGDDLCLPRWEPPRFAGRAEEFPFQLAPYRGINYGEGGVRHLPWLREIPAAGFLAWEETIDMNPADARRLGLSQGDTAWLESPAGKRRMRVRVNAGTRPGTIGLPLGHGPWPPQPDDPETAGGHGLLAALSDPLSGLHAHQGTRARVWKEEA